MKKSLLTRLAKNGNPSFSLLLLALVALGFLFVGGSNPAGSSDPESTSYSFPSEFIGYWVSEQPAGWSESVNGTFKPTTLEFGNSSNVMGESWGYLNKGSNQYSLIYHDGGINYTIKYLNVSPINKETTMEISILPNGKMKIEYEPFGGLLYTKQ
jgi:hypothetical protein